MARSRVVIIGAGFGGLACARALAHCPADVLVIDRNNYHLFTPLLYQVASSLLNAADIARPVRTIFKDAGNVRFRQGEVSGVDLAGRTVEIVGAPAEPYDYLVIAAGSTTNFFAVEGAEEHSLGLKDLAEALELRNHVLGCLEHASVAPTGEATSWLTFVVAGGGPTGVEYAGALSELARLILPEYPELEGRRIRIMLVEGLSHVLPPFPASLREAARHELERKGIEVRTDTRVEAAVSKHVLLSTGEEIGARTLVWAAGVRPAALAAGIDAARTRSGRLAVDATLRLRGSENVFAIGDVAGVAHGDREVPMLSAPAMQEGRHAAKNIVRLSRGEAPLPFRYRDRGSMATIGKNAAVASIGPVRLRGFVGWVTWLAVHLYFLIGFRNRLAVLAGWAWNYLRSDRPVRIIARARERR